MSDVRRRKDPEEDAEVPVFKVEDRRHWARGDRPPDDADDDAEPVSTAPTVVDEYRRRAEDAERKLHEYIAAFKEVQAEQEAFRERLGRDVERRVDLRFGELVADLLDTLDDLDLALSHVRGVESAEPLAEGVALARDRFLAALERHGVERIEVLGREFDPNVAEALRVDPVADADMDGKVVEVLRPGYRLGERVLRPPRVAVGRAGG